MAFMPCTEGFIGITVIGEKIFDEIPSLLKLTAETNLCPYYNDCWMVHQDGSSSWSNGIPGALEVRTIIFRQGENLTCF
jgi:hypothetical protein